KKDGTLFWCRVNITSFEHSRYGRVYMSINEDITDRKQVEEALHEQQQFITRIASTTPGIIYVHEYREGCFDFVNQQITSLLGYTPDEIHAMGRAAIRHLLHPDDYAEAARWFAGFETAPDGEIREAQYRFVHADGSGRWLHLRETIFSRYP